VCFDAKITFDDNAYFRQKFIFGMRDTGDSREVYLLLLLLLLLTLLLLLL
jgi:hypothetical protein